jgi:nucleoside-diphosphate-sugar epimerase
MRSAVWDVRWREAIPRMIVDFAIVHLSGIVALIAAASIHVEHDGAVTTGALAVLLRTYYLDIFMPLSLVFPAVFLLSGFYSVSRNYQWRYKWRTLLRGSAAANLIYLFASFLATRDKTLPRSSILACSILVIAGTLGVRWLKARILTVVPSEPIAPIAPQCDDKLVLVVGGAGYIGSILVRKLLASGNRVRILDSLMYGHGAIRDLLDDPRLELTVGDCRNIQSVVAAVRGVRSIIHLAAIVGDPACEQDRQAALEINYAATRMLIEVAKGQRVERLIFASSCSVYGSSDSVMDERSKVNPISLYAHTKCDSETALLEAATESFHPTILRFATIFGNSHRPRFDLVVNLLTAKAYQEGVITIFNGQQWRPFLHVDDVARAITEVLRAPVAIVSGEVFNVGDSRLNFTLSGIADKIAAHFPDTRIEQVENSDRRNYRVNFDRFNNVIGFKAAYDLDDGIRELRSAFEQGVIADYTDPLFHNQRFLEKACTSTNISQLDAFVMAAFSRPMPAPVTRGSWRFEADPTAGLLESKAL